MRHELVLAALSKEKKPSKKPIELGTHMARYAYQLACYRRLLPLEKQIRQCVNTQRLIGGEFHGRLDFQIEPGGKLKRFAVNRGLDQLQACLMPHVLPITFPSYTGKEHFTLMVLVGSEGCRLGRRTKARPVKIYPVSTPDEQKIYKRAAGWVASPWSNAISTCAEWVDRSMGYGYRVQVHTSIAPAGKITKAEVLLRGKLASNAVDRLVGCITPFVQGMRLPRHAGPDGIAFMFGSSTARWGLD